MNQAWLIITHNEFDILKRLISLLDNEQSDFFVHIDKKVKELPALSVKKGRLFILKDRVDVRWGSVSQIETELVLLEAALQNGPYSHYHILSGTHLPLKPVNELIEFYNNHADEVVARCWPKDDGDADFKLRRYHFPLRHYKFGSAFQRRICQLTWRCVIKVQIIIGIRHLKKEAFIKTDNWLSLTENACKYLVSNKKQVLKKYRWSFCGDEYFVASELKEKGFRFFDCQNLLYVQFQYDTPSAIALDDYPRIQETGCLWARKFSSNHAH